MHIKYASQNPIKKLKLKFKSTKKTFNQNAHIIRTMLHKQNKTDKTFKSGKKIE